MKIREETREPEPKEKTSRPGDDAPLEGSQPTHTYLVDSDGGVRETAQPPEKTPAARLGSYVLWIAIAIGILAVLALIGTA